MAAQGARGQTRRIGDGRCGVFEVEFESVEDLANGSDEVEVDNQAPTSPF